MHCATCNEEIPEGKKFCPECGTPVSAVAKCKSCGAEITPGKKFCAECGTPVSAAFTAPELQSEPAPITPKRKSVLGGTLRKVIDTKAERIACKATGHVWDGCICTNCGKRRDDGHQWKPVPGECKNVCAICGEYKTVDHDYQQIEDSCNYVCAICGDTKKEHAYERLPEACRFECVRCGHLKVEHSYQPVLGRCIDSCIVCGDTKTVPHEYNDKHRCKRCGEKEPRSIIDRIEDAVVSQPSTIIRGLTDISANVATAANAAGKKRRD
jgi:hypothetical protein